MNTPLWLPANPDSPSEPSLVSSGAYRIPLHHSVKRSDKELISSTPLHRPGGSLSALVHKCARAQCAHRVLGEHNPTSRAQAYNPHTSPSSTHTPFFASLLSTGSTVSETSCSDAGKSASAHQYEYWLKYLCPSSRRPASTGAQFQTHFECSRRRDRALRGEHIRRLFYTGAQGVFRGKQCEPPFHS